jgi:hypothetical protein
VLDLDLCKRCDAFSEDPIDHRRHMMKVMRPARFWCVGWGCLIADKNLKREDECPSECLYCVEQLFKTSSKWFLLKRFVLRLLKKW